MTSVQHQEKSFPQCFARTKQRQTQLDFFCPSPREKEMKRDPSVLTCVDMAADWTGDVMLLTFALHHAGVGLRAHLTSTVTLRVPGRASWCPCVLLPVDGSVTVHAGAFL